MPAYVEHHRLPSRDDKRIKARMNEASRRWAREDRAYGHRPLTRKRVRQQDRAYEALGLGALVVIGWVCYALFAASI